MKIAIHQPNFLPWIGYFYKISNVDIFVFLDNVQYTKNSFQNRVRIKTSQGSSWLTVPVVYKFGQLTNEVMISNRDKWREKHLKTLEANYRKSPYFEPIFSLLKVVYLKYSWESMSDFNVELITRICCFLNIKTQLIRASTLNVTGSSTELLINIIRKLNGQIYLSGKGGAKYQDEEKFKNDKITLRYTDYKLTIYPQLWGNFIEGLSIIDLLFNCGEKSLNYILSNNFIK